MPTRVRSLKEQNKHFQLTKILTLTHTPGFLWSQRKINNCLKCAPIRQMSPRSAPKNIQWRVDAGRCPRIMESIIMRVRNLVVLEAKILLIFCIR